MAVMTAIAVTGALVGAGMGVATAIKAREDEEDARLAKEEQEQIQ